MIEMNAWLICFIKCLTIVVLEIAVLNLEYSGMLTKLRSTPA